MGTDIESTVFGPTNTQWYGVVPTNIPAWYLLLLISNAMVFDPVKYCIVVLFCYQQTVGC